MILSFCLERKELAFERTTIASPIIELGLRAALDGEPVLLGNRTVFQLGQLLDNLTSLGNGLAALNESNLAGAIPQIVAAAKILAETAPIIRGQLQGNCLSNTTFTN